MFVYGNELILIGSVPAIVLAIITASIGVGMLSGAVQGWCIGLGKITNLERVWLCGGSLLLLKPGWITDIIGLLIFLVLFFLHYWRKRS